MSHPANIAENCIAAWNETDSAARPRQAERRMDACGELRRPRRTRRGPNRHQRHDRRRAAAIPGLPICAGGRSVGAWRIRAVPLEIRAGRRRARG